jgi:hypothetical protein
MPWPTSNLGYHPLAPSLDAAADHAGDSRRAGLAVARAWDNMMTDTRGYLSRPAAEAGHLALWTGILTLLSVLCPLCSEWPLLSK